MYLCFMDYDKIFIWAVLSYWILSGIYMIRWHKKQKNLSYGTVILSFLIGAAFGPIVWQTEREIKRESPNFRHRVPPPISRIERAISDRDDAIRSARERLNLEEVRGEWRRQNGISKLKDFKFLQK